MLNPGKMVACLAPLSLALVLVVAACGGGSDPTAAPAATATTAPAATTRPAPTPMPTPKPVSRALTVALTAVPANLDCDKTSQRFDSWVCRTIYDRLANHVYTDQGDGTRLATSELVGMLAESWEFKGNPDGSATTTLHLRQNAVSPAGNRMTANDVKWSFDRLLGTKRIGNFVLRVSGITDPEQVVVVDDSTIQLKTSEPNALTLSAAIPLHTQAIIDSTEAKQHTTDEDPWADNWLKKNTAGFGPYQQGEYVAEGRFVYEINPGWWNDAPFFETVTVVQVPDGSSRLTSLLAGSVDMIFDISADERARVAREDGFRAVKFDGNSHTTLRMHSEIEPYNNLKVRQAIAYAFPYDEVVEGVFKGEAPRMRSFVPPGIHTDYIPAYQFETDIEKAKALLAAAGYPEGFKTKITLTSGYQEVPPISIYLISALAKIGIDVTLETLAPSPFKSALRAKETPIFLENSSSTVLNTGFAVSLFFLDKGIVNYTKYNNPRVNELHDLGLRTIDPVAQSNIWKEVQQIVADDVPWVYITYPGITVAGKDDLVGWHWYPGNQIHWQSMGRE